MSISSIANPYAARQWQAMQRAQTSPAPSATTAADPGAGTTNSIGTAVGALSGGGAGAQAPYDAIKVALPNGISIEVVHFGSTVDAATEDQMVKSAEQMAGALQGYSGADAGTQASSNGAAPAADASGSQGSDAPPGGSADMIQVNLPNGISFEVEHSAAGSETDAESKAVADQMVKAAEDLAAALKAYSGTSSSTTANTTPSSLLPAGLTA